MSLFTLPQDVFAQHFPELGFKIQHHLQHSPLFSLSRLVSLSRTLPEEHVEYNSGTLTPNHGNQTVPFNGLSIEDTIKAIETCQSWMVLKFVEQDNAYRQLLDACLDEIYLEAGKKLTGLHKRSAFIFITSPNSVTPYHIDPEHNFLLQIRGNKTMYQFDKHNPNLLPEALLEEKYYKADTNRNLPFQAAFQTQAKCFDLQPGEGLFVPINVPHWVQNGDNVSISFSITFHSTQSDREARLHKMNGWLRQHGLTPSPLGKCAWRDQLKYQSFMLMRKTAHLLKSNESG